jgi:hypothetical protein
VGFLATPSSCEAYLGTDGSFRLDLLMPLSSLHLLGRSVDASLASYRVFSGWLDHGVSRQWCGVALPLWERFEDPWFWDGLPKPEQLLWLGAGVHKAMRSGFSVLTKESQLVPWGRHPASGRHSSVSFTKRVWFSPMPMKLPVGSTPPPKRKPYKQPYKHQHVVAGFTRDGHMVSLCFVWWRP